MIYETTDDLPIVIKKLLPRDALEVFRVAANAADDEHGALVAGWEEVSKGWRKPDKKGCKWVKKPKKKATMENDSQSGDAKMNATIIKADDEQRVAYGWASVISENGNHVIDTQGDIIEPDELLKATTDFMQDARLAKAMHDGGGIGEVLHSFPLTHELAKSLGIDCNREGWIVGVKVHDDDIWAKVKDGTYASFSIGGFGNREEVE